MTVNYKQRPSAEELLDHIWIVDTPVIDVEQEIIQESLNNLQNFSFHNKFQQGIVNFLTYTTSERDEIKKLSEIFKQIDLNNDGKISKDEMSLYIKKIMGTCKLIASYKFRKS